ncbi:PREDICTED: thaumatin [Prunus dulcis]|uniref:PREDICTED: thaumatin n=1 Tax=Prunus dulcis TaxID=3755 RepID=A0A5E4F0V8_PRUDU|nr:PREDICTED: thaumatin [Prunus dulcis]
MAALLRCNLTLMLSTLLFLHVLVEVSSATTITMHNKCSHPVWPGIQPSAGQPILARGGFTLPPNKAYTLHLPPLWSGRLWGRHGCAFDSSGRGRCATGDCGGNLFSLLLASNAIYFAVIRRENDGYFGKASFLCYL